MTVSEVKWLYLPDLEVAPGQEIPFLCQSVTLGNEEALYVTSVTMEAGPGWHHSNWFFVPETLYPGPDGTWNCDERGFGSLEAGLAGGVLFAQSTQAQSELQAFQWGAVVTVPPRSRIVGQVHLLNASDAAITTSISLGLEHLDRDKVSTFLSPVTLAYTDLAIPPQTRSRFAADCDFAAAYGAPVDMHIHYVLPHYHGLGEGLFLQAVGGAADGQTIYETDSPIGEPLGGTVEPPFALENAQGLRFGCSFNNTGDTTVGWGIGDQEMCVLLAFVDSPLKWLGGVNAGTARVGNDNGVETYQGPCQVLVF